MVEELLYSSLQSFGCDVRTDPDLGPDSFEDAYDAFDFLSPDILCIDDSSTISSEMQRFSQGFSTPPEEAWNTSKSANGKLCMCAECGHITSTNVELQEHGEKVKHKPFACLEHRCGKTFARHDCYARHRKMHEECAFECQVCPFTCKRKDNLERHLERVHRKHSRWRTESCSGQSSIAPTPMPTHQLALQSTPAWRIPEKSGLKCVAGTLRHIIEDGGFLADVESMIDELDSDGTQDLAQKLAWTMRAHPPTRMVTA